MKNFFLCVAALFVATAVSAHEGVKINGVVWAQRNVDTRGTFTDSAKDYGMLYQWNRPTGWSAAKNRHTTTDETWNPEPAAGKEFSKDNDPCPKGWQVPTMQQIEKLLDKEKVNALWVNMDDTTLGYTFIDRQTGKSIFLPAAGGRNARGEYSAHHSKLGLIGGYWTATRSSETRGVCLLFYNKGFNPVKIQSLANGYSIRCVKK